MTIKKFLYISLFCSPILSHAGGVPNLCNLDEFIVLTATMGNFDKANQYHKNGKVVSICTDKEKGKLNKLVYRYGKVGAVEMEQFATPQNKFHQASITTSPKTGLDMIWFKKGNFNYYISSASGMGQGVFVTVFNSGKKIVDQFSGTEPLLDFETPGYIDEKLNRDLITYQNPIDDNRW
jgi:hypothetical protein